MNRNYYFLGRKSTVEDGNTRCEIELASSHLIRLNRIKELYGKKGGRQEYEGCRRDYIYTDCRIEGGATSCLDLRSKK